MKVKMKKKKINKISKKIFNQISKNYTIVKKKKPINENKYYTGAVEPTESREEEYICEYDEDISAKFKKLFNNIIKYPDNIKIGYTDPISITIEVPNIKYIKTNPPPSNGNLVKSNGDDYLSIHIVNNKYFTISQGYSKLTKYKDPNLYNELIDVVKDKVKEINANNFNTIWENISRESGILRDSNLDEILND